jgi:hypothetical protein
LVDDLNHRSTVDINVGVVYPATSIGVPVGEYMKLEGMREDT